MDLHTQLYLHCGLYDRRAIETVLEPTRDWNLISAREKEKRALHLHICSYICNMETLNNEPGEIIERMKRKAETPAEEEEKPAKTAKMEKDARKTTEPSGEQIAGASYMTIPGATEDKPRSNEEMMEEEEMNILQEYKEGLRYRFEMLVYNIGSEMKQNDFCEQNNIAEQSILWDIIDHKEKKLINVRIGTDTDRIISKWEDDSMEAPEKFALISVNPLNMEITYKNVDKKPDGDAKVKTLLAQRKASVTTLGILETEMGTRHEGLIDSVLNSSYIKGMVKEWMDDNRATENVDTPDGNLFKSTYRETKNIKPSDLLEKLINVETVNKSAPEIVWKGRVMPEGTVLNIYTHSPKDDDNVETMVKKMREALKNLEEVIIIKSTKHDLENTLEDILEVWERSEKKTFTVSLPRASEEAMRVAKMAGHKEKKREFNPDFGTLRQKETKELEQRKYSKWIEFVYQTLEQTPNIPENRIPMAQLLEMAPTDSHPMNRISEPMTTLLFKRMLKTNVGIYSSKIAALYSRLGSSYRSHSQRERVSDHIAYIPIIAPLRDENNHSVEERLIHGICVRGPQHVKNPTDRIGMIMIELIDNSNPLNIELAKKCSVGKLYKCNGECSVLVRPTSIMKEDTCYATFCTNSLFLVANNLGYMTMEQPNTPGGTDMIKRIEETIDIGERFFIERFIDGILFTCIGNSRDEGYFASLRKLFMVVLSWRNSDPCSNFDIDSFCKKTNDCLIDNPIGMYFHKYLMRVIRFYDDRRKKL